MILGNIIKKHIILICFFGGVINTISILSSSLAGGIVGLFVAWVEFNIIVTLFSEARVKYLLIAALINTSTTYILLSISCLFFENLACQRNPIVLSLLPGIILVTLALFLALNIKKRIE